MTFLLAEQERQLSAEAHGGSYVAYDSSVMKMATRDNPMLASIHANATNGNMARNERVEIASIFVQHTHRQLQR